MTDKIAITPEEAGTLCGLFAERVKRTPDKVAYRQYDVASQSWHSSTWAEMATEVARWQAAMQREELKVGDRVGVMMRNSREWVVFDQAALGLGLVTVPLYVEDRPDNVAYIINDADVKLLFVQTRSQWQKVLDVSNKLPGLQRIVSLAAVDEEDQPQDDRLISLREWLFGLKGELQSGTVRSQQLASIVYTSGTTGRPKGVMLTHRNIAHNAYNAYLSSLESPGDEFRHDDVYLSFLPLSHTFERTVGYYLPMMVGAEVAYARSIPQLGEDLLTIRPTVLVSVPRIFERVYAKIQEGLAQKSPKARALFQKAVDVGWKRFEYKQGRGRWSPSFALWPALNKLVASKVVAKLGGRLNKAVSGGAPLSPEVAKVFIGLGVPVIQGYGLTESSPVISTNRCSNNLPSSIGPPIPNVHVRIGEDDELQSKSESVMLGYWNNEEATREMFTEDGWLKTGDKARLDEDGRIYITGRLKDILVLANGEKVPPSDMELAIALDNLFEQVMVIGEGKPYLTALVVLNPDLWGDLAAKCGVDPENLDSLRHESVELEIKERISSRLREFPGYAQVRRVTAYLDPWTVDNGLLTPTLKVKRRKVMEQYQADVDAMYAGHEVQLG